MNVPGRRFLQRNATGFTGTALQGKEPELEEERLADFVRGADERTFEIEPVCGVWDVSFVFLPGSSFDFYQVQFHKGGE